MTHNEQPNRYGTPDDMKNLPRPPARKSAKKKPVVVILTLAAVAVVAVLWGMFWTVALGLNDRPSNDTPEGMYLRTVHHHRSSRLDLTDPQLLGVGQESCTQSIDNITGVSPYDASVIRGAAAIYLCR